MELCDYCGLESLDGDGFCGSCAASEIDAGDCATISDCGRLGGMTRAVFCGRVLGEFSEEEDALLAIVETMEAESYRPSVYRVSDHGNIIPVVSLPNPSDCDPRCDECGERHPTVAHNEDCEHWHEDADAECTCGDNVVGRNGYVSVNVACIDAAS